MSKISIVGLDLAKNVFQVHAVDAAGAVVLRQQLRRAQVEKFFAGLPAAVVGMEACAGAHHWARVIGKYGHEVRLMPPAYVKPYVKRNKNDGRDAEGTCEAAGRPTMRFVAVKSVEQQAVLIVHSTRTLLVRQRTMAANALRAALSEFGIVAAQGVNGLRTLIEQLKAPSEATVSEVARGALLLLVRQWEALDADVRALERAIVRTARGDEAARRLMGRSPASARSPRARPLPRCPMRVCFAGRAILRRGSGSPAAAAAPAASTAAGRSPNKEIAR